MAVIDRCPITGDTVLCTEEECENNPACEPKCEWWQRVKTNMKNMKAKKRGGDGVMIGISKIYEREDYPEGYKWEKVGLLIGTEAFGNRAFWFAARGYMCSPGDKKRFTEAERIIDYLITAVNKMQQKDKKKEDEKDNG